MLEQSTASVLDWKMRGIGPGLSQCITNSLFYFQPLSHPVSTLATVFTNPDKSTDDLLIFKLFDSEI